MHLILMPSFVFTGMFMFPAMAKKVTAKHLRAITKADAVRSSSLCGDVIKLGDDAFGAVWAWLTGLVVDVRHDGRLLASPKQNGLGLIVAP